jgi:hypothetical protein
MKGQRTAVTLTRSPSFPQGRLREGEGPKLVVNSTASLGLTLPPSYISRPNGQVAQLVEQRTENPRVGGSIPSLAIPRNPFDRMP